MRKQLMTLAVPAVLTLFTAVSPLLADDDDQVKFNMVVSGGAKACLPHASGNVRITDYGTVQVMDVSVQGLPPNTDFDFFVLQVPKAPFGLAWYQGDIQTDKNGKGRVQVRGIFSIETFTVAPGPAPAPVVFGGPFPDASVNPPFNPIQMYHLGLWFDDPADAAKAGCPASVTPFNGAHNAGIQVLNTSNFADDQGPLRKLDTTAAAAGK